MLTVEDITGFFLDNAADPKKISKCDFRRLPVIESWVGLVKQGKAIIKGRIHHHPKHPQGVKINTSSVTGYFSDKGHVYITTKNSIYELGQPLHEVELVMKVPEFQDLEKITVWS